LSAVLPELPPQARRIETVPVSDHVPRTVRVSATKDSLFLSDLGRGRSWVVRAEDGRTIAEMLDVVLRLAWTDVDHLEFVDPLAEKQFHALVDPE
jgi:hypothetical protein